MFYLSIDTETTGLDPKTCQLLEFSAVRENTNDIKELDDLPAFNAMFKYSEIKGEPYALNLNANLIQNIKDGIGNIYDMSIEEDAARFYKDFSDFINKYYYVPENPQKSLLLAGKNIISFDIPFINNTLGLFTKKNSPAPWQFKVMHRTIDPSILYTNFEKDAALPSSDECVKRYKRLFNDNRMDLLQRHTATDDAKMVIQLLRPFYKVFDENSIAA